MTMWIPDYKAIDEPICVEPRAEQLRSWDGTHTWDLSFPLILAYKVWTGEAPGGQPMAIEYGIDVNESRVVYDTLPISNLSPVGLWEVFRLQEKPKTIRFRIEKGDGWLMLSDVILVGTRSVP